MKQHVETVVWTVRFLAMMEHASKNLRSVMADKIATTGRMKLTV